MKKLIVASVFVLSAGCAGYAENPNNVPQQRLIPIKSETVCGKLRVLVCDKRFRNCWCIDPLADYSETRYV